MTVKELLKKDRSYRSFDESRRITKEELEDLVDCTRYTPSSVNIQPLRYFLAWQPEQVAAIQPLTRWARGLPGIELPPPGHCPTAFIVICQDLDVHPSVARFEKDVGIAAQAMLMAATEKGLGGCMIGNYNKDDVKNTLGLPENLTPVLVVALGKPDETIVITEVGEDGSTKYYRDGGNTHYVPKRSLKDLLI